MATFEDVADMHHTAVLSLNQRMSEFEAQIKTLTPGVNVDVNALYKDFSSFKQQVWGVFSALQQKIQEVSKGIDSLEMHHRKKFLLLGGVSEVPNENIPNAVTSVLQNKFGLSDLKPSSLTVCHRLGTVSENRPRPILLRFADPTVRALLWKTKTKLKGTPLVLSEFLTRQRQTAFGMARRIFGVKNAWTLDGNIFVKTPDGKRHRVFDHDQVVALGTEHGKSAEASSSHGTQAPVVKAKTAAPQMSTRPKRTLKTK